MRFLILAAALAAAAPAPAQPTWPAGRASDQL